MDQTADSDRVGNALHSGRKATLARSLPLLLVLIIGSAITAVPVIAGSLPDLAVQNVWIEKVLQVGQPASEISPGEQFYVVATVTNSGSATASGYYVDAYYDSEYGRGGPDNIAAGEVQEWYVGPVTAQSGTHTTRWVVDPDNQIQETNETNNEKQYSFTVGSQTVTTTVTSSSTTTSTVESTLSTTTTTTTSTYYTTSSQTPPPTLTLNPNSGPIGTLVSVSGLNYQGTTCFLSSVPATLFSSQACSVVAGTLTGNFTVASAAPAGDYTVGAQTNAGPADSARSMFTVGGASNTPPPAVSVSDASVAIFNASGMSAYFIGTSNPYDNQALLGAWGKTSAQDELGPWTRSDWIDQATGQPLVRGDLFLVAGPLANPVVGYYSSRGLAVGFRFSNGYAQIVYRGQVLAQMTEGDIGRGKDMFVVQAWKDGDRPILAIWGIGAQGTLASGVWLLSNFGQLGSLHNSIYVYGWTDSNGDTYPQPDEISLIYQGD